MYQTKSFRDKPVCVIVSTFFIFMFVEQLIFVEVFSQLYYLTHAKKQTMADFRYKSINSWKIDNIDLTQQSSLSIFTDFRYQSIKITWLLPIFIDWLLRVYFHVNSLRKKSYYLVFGILVQNIFWGYHWLSAIWTGFLPNFHGQVLGICLHTFSW